MTSLHIKMVSHFSVLLFYYYYYYSLKFDICQISNVICANVLVPGPCDPEDLLDGVIFGAKYLGSTQIKSERNPSTNARMAQAQEAVDRIKVL